MITVQHLPEITEAATRMLRRGGPSTIWEGIEALIEDGHAHLFAVTNGSYLVLSVTASKELFIHACAGRRAVVLMQLCIQIAKANNCTSVLFRTIKKGLPRLLGEFSPVEVRPQIYKVSV